jgi:FlaA1/EpsC-like NDP-sugar epimerase
MHRFVSARLFSQLATLDRSVKQALMFGSDALLLIFALWASWSLRFGELFVPNSAQLLLMLAAPFLALPVFLKMGLFRSVIRYLGEQALWSVVKAMSLAALLWSAVAFMTQMYGVEGVPRSIPLLYWLLGLVLVSGSRFAARWLLWSPLRARFGGRQVLIYGAGGAGRQLVVSLRQGQDLFPAGFLDDDKTLHGKDVDGLRVYAPTQLSTLIERFDIRDVIVTLSSASKAQQREVVMFLEQYPLRVRILPAMADIASGKHLVNLVREVDVGDLLGRDPVSADPALLARCITDKSVMVTGAGGSIGSELCRQIAAIGPARLVLLESSEHALYQVERRIRAETDCEVVTVLGSVGDEERVFQLLAQYKVQTLYHAAAYKHVPMLESNVLEGVRNNVLGTLKLSRAAFEAGVEHFVLISTDKAVRPTNIMGATKRWAEWIVGDFAQQAVDAGTGQCFCAVRFGNVLDSSGSVIPLFKEQIAGGGPVTVTHAEVTRYFMSIHEAVELVIQAGSMSDGGEVFLLDMGEPVKIMELARNMVNLTGHTVKDDSNPHGDIEITVTGLRPGEKLYEELLINNGNIKGTSHPRILKACEPGGGAMGVAHWLERLSEAMDNRDVDRVHQLLLGALDTELDDQDCRLRLVSEQ